MDADKRRRPIDDQSGLRSSAPTCGHEWIVEAHGCDSRRLTNRASLESLFARIVEELRLHPVGPSTWHQFPITGGITGLSLLSESHITCHTFPEYGSACLNVFCCRPRADWNFEGALRDLLGAASVNIRKVERPYH
jgi:S-adenosylmethionine decarboxylase